MHTCAPRQRLHSSLQRRCYQTSRVRYERSHKAMYVCAGSRCRSTTTACYAQDSLARAETRQAPSRFRGFRSAARSCARRRPGDGLSVQSGLWGNKGQPLHPHRPHRRRNASFGFEAFLRAPRRRDLWLGSHDARLVDRQWACGLDDVFPGSLLNPASVV